LQRKPRAPTRATAPHGPARLDWLPPGASRGTAPPPWTSDGLLLFSHHSGLPWYVGELPGRWLAKHHGLALTRANLASGPPTLRGIPADTRFYADTMASRMLAPVRDAIRAAGGHVLLSCDEEFWHLPPWIAVGPRFAEEVHRIERNLRAADRVVVFSARMAERVTRFNRSISVIPHALPPLAELPPPAGRRDRAGIRIGWAGSDGHRGDLEMIGPAVCELLARRPDVTFVLAGQCHSVSWAQALRDSPQLDLHAGSVWLPAYYRWIASLDLDAFICPLVDHPFNQVKPALKPLEAAGLGIPVLASAIGSYADELRHEETALLVTNTEAWLAALLRLVDDADLRAHLSAGGRAWAATRTIEQTGDAWAKVWGAR